ncbi:sarcoplasmic calcium-binding protein-like [Lingula anatina]|uniref:Sarcoplasmic calcium-binding protein-like n=1 Tax=Lingula anatina TaxID=7574 RepID=A0A1S3IQN0_LINAN|nr:sarcoplasmic calcium-binding protein-like [Lingula anatina]|eukprot:XP_013400525.1 sarcoplasmic calcium-binding protein-like [Lingula anatina]
MASAPPPYYWLRKLRSFFVLHDRDLDGVISREDVVDYPVNRAKTFLGETKAKDLEILLSRAWADFLGGDNQTATFDAIIGNFARTFTDPNFSDVNSKMAELMFTAVDINNDNMVTLEEYIRVLECFGVHPLSVKPSFEALDANKDGLISKEEFIEAAVQYFQCTCESPGALFWGPLRA